RYRAVQIQPVSREEPVRLNPKCQNQIAARSAAHPQLALPAQSQLGAGIHPSRDRDLNLLLLPDLTATMPCRARLGRHDPLPHAAGPGPGHPETPLSERHRAGATALRAGDDTRTRRRAVPPTRVATLGAGYGDRELPSSRCQLEGDLYRILDRGSALWPLRTCPPLPGIEDRAEQVAQPSESAQIFKGEATAPTRSCACEAACPRTRATHRREGPVAAHLVVLLSLRLVAEDR